MPKLKEYDRKKIEKAVQDVLSKRESYRSAEWKYGIPKLTIEFRIKHPEHKSTCGPSPVLTEDEERTLVKWVTEMARKGFPRKANDLKSSVQKFLTANPRKNTFTNNRPGDGWVKAFLKRHRELSDRTSESVTSASACVSEKDIRRWFLEIENYIKENGLQDAIADPSRVFNGDETGFQISPSTEKVFAQRGSKNVYTVDRGSSKENITVMFSFSASGDTCVPMIIYPYMRFPEKIAKSLNPEWGIGRSPNGWMTSETFFQYIANVFHPHLVKNKVTFPVILFLDGHKSHLNYTLSILCKELQIEIFALYPNATRILQPCDVAVFRPLKEAWRRTVREWNEEHPEDILNKVTFAPVLDKALKSSVKPEILVNGFRACGLCPFNPDAIDYTKCLGRNSTNTETNTNPGEINKVMDFDTFRNIVGEEKIFQFQIINEQIPAVGSNDFLSLFKIWKHFNDKSEDKSIHEELTSTINNKDQNEINVINQNTIQNTSSEQTLINPIHTAMQKEPEMIKIPDNISSSAKTSETNETDDISTETTTDVSTNPIDKKLEEDFQTGSKIRIIDSSLFGQYLTTPESPKRKGKRNTDRIPFAITSKKCQEMFEKKLQIKENEKKNKEERKRKREEKLNAKKETTSKGKLQARKKNKESKSCFTCKATIYSENNVVQCDTCKYYFHEKCIPQKHRKFIVDKDDEDEIFLCHMCYREAESDSMESSVNLDLDEDDVEVDELYADYKASIVFCPSFSKREKLLKWASSRLPLHWSSHSTTLSGGLVEMWTDGSLLCTLINSAVPGACPNPHRHWKKPPVHAQAIAYKYLQVIPIFTENDLSGNFTINQERNFIHYLEELQQAINKLSMKDDSVRKFTSQYVARGMGLVTGEQHKKTVFYIYPNTERRSDVIIHIKGPYGTYGNATVSHFRSTLPFVVCTSPTEENGSEEKHHSFFRQISLELASLMAPKKKDIGDAISIEIEAEDSRVKVTYLPKNYGMYEINLISNGELIGGCPYHVHIVNSEESFETGENKKAEKQVLKKIISSKIDFSNEHKFIDARTQFILRQSPISEQISLKEISNNDIKNNLINEGITDNLNDSAKPNKNFEKPLDIPTTNEGNKNHIEFTKTVNYISAENDEYIIATEKVENGVQPFADTALLAMKKNNSNEYCPEEHTIEKEDWAESIVESETNTETYEKVDNVLSDKIQNECENVDSIDNSDVIQNQVSLNSESFTKVEENSISDEITNDDVSFQITEKINANQENIDDCDKSSNKTQICQGISNKSKPVKIKKRSIAKLDSNFIKYIANISNIEDTSINKILNELSLSSEDLNNNTIGSKTKPVDSINHEPDNNVEVIQDSESEIFKIPSRFFQGTHSSREDVDASPICLSHIVHEVVDNNTFRDLSLADKRKVFQRQNSMSLSDSQNSSFSNDENVGVSSKGSYDVNGLSVLNVLTSLKKTEKNKISSRPDDSKKENIRSFEHSENTQFTLENTKSLPNVHSLGNGTITGIVKEKKYFWEQMTFGSTTSLNVTLKPSRKLTVNKKYGSNASLRDRLIWQKPNDLISNRTNARSVDDISVIDAPISLNIKKYISLDESLDHCETVPIEERKRLLLKQDYEKERNTWNDFKVGTVRKSYLTKTSSVGPEFFGMNDFDDTRKPKPAAVSKVSEVKKELSKANFNTSQKKIFQNDIPVSRESFKMHFKKAIHFFKRLEEKAIHPTRKPTKKDINEDVKKTRRRYSLDFDRSKTRPKKKGGSLNLSNVSQRFSIDNLYSDIFGDQKNSFRGVPNKDLAAETLASFPETKKTNNKKYGNEDDHIKYNIFKKSRTKQRKSLKSIFDVHY